MDRLEFARRLTVLRLAKGVSARDMSLSIGQSSGYINNIENGVNLPSMSLFFSICDYLEITPMDFFDTGAKNPGRINDLCRVCRELTDVQVEHLLALAEDLKPE